MGKPGRKICHRTRVVGIFPDKSSAQMPVCASLHHAVDTQRGNRKRIDLTHLEATLDDVCIVNWL